MWHAYGIHKIWQWRPPTLFLGNSLIIVMNAIPVALIVVIYAFLTNYDSHILGLNNISMYNNFFHTAWSILLHVRQSI